MIPPSLGSWIRCSTHLWTKKRSRGAPPPAPRLVLVVPGCWSVGLGFAAPLAARSARGAVACSKAVGFSAPLAQMPGVFRRPVARPRRLL